MGKRANIHKKLQIMHKQRFFPQELKFFLQIQLMASLVRGERYLAAIFFRWCAGHVLGALGPFLTL